MVGMGWNGVTSQSDAILSFCVLHFLHFLLSAFCFLHFHISAFPAFPAFPHFRIFAFRTMCYVRSNFRASKARQSKASEQRNADDDDNEDTSPTLSNSRVSMHRYGVAECTCDMFFDISCEGFCCGSSLSLSTGIKLDQGQDQIHRPSKASGGFLSDSSWSSDRTWSVDRP